MKNQSQITKKYRAISIILFWLSIIVTIAPVVVYTAIAFYNGEVHEKLTLGLTLIVAIILTAINIIFKFHIRSILWIMVLGIYICLDNIMPLLLVVAVGTILDEFILSPLHKHYKNKARINAEIDKRL